MAIAYDLADVLHFECPRCGRDVSGPYYGPCEGCLGELRVRYQAEGSPVARIDYEPKMNVTPNAVALKDD